MTQSSVSVILVTRWPTRSWNPHAVMIARMAPSAFSASSLSASDSSPSAESRMRAAASSAVLRMAASSRNVFKSSVISAVTEWSLSPCTALRRADGGFRLVLVPPT